MTKALIGFAFALTLVAQAPKPKDSLSDADVQDVIRKFSEKESAFAKARAGYTYRQTVRVLDIGSGGRTVGKHEVTSDIVFIGDPPKRTEHVVKAPVPDLKNFQLEPNDEADLRNVQPFVLTAEDVDKYNVRYLGKEKLDEIGCYAFAVKPKQMEKGKRYFSGIIWVDDRDMQIVKSYGRGVGNQSKGSAYPKFETYREQIDGKYWFPTYTVADSELQFAENTAHIRMTVKYEDYKQFKSQSTITFEDTVAEPGDLTPSKTEAPKTSAPKTEAPKVEAPKANAPKIEAPKAAKPADGGFGVKPPTSEPPPLK
jgi:hypothetical protein